MTAARIAVFGAGAWGTALANVVARAGREVSLIARDEARAEAMRRSGVNPRLPGIRVDERIVITTDLASAARADAVLLVMPAQSLRAGAKALAAAGVTGPVIACAKGIERSTGQFMTEVVAEHLPRAHAAILSGPSFAEDVARGLPTAVTLAAQDEAQARELSHALGSPTFRVYHSTDVRGVEIGGAAKNVLAIAAGIVSGRRLGASAAAALTTRGFAEIVRFGRAFGARPETLMGLAGLGDLILTCSSPQSRNYSLGIAMGRGSTGQDSGEAKLAEGAFTAAVLVESARTKGVELPIAAVVAAILDNQMTIDEAIETLLARPVGAED